MFRRIFYWVVFTKKLHYAYLSKQSVVSPSWKSLEYGLLSDHAAGARGYHLSEGWWCCFSVSATLFIAIKYQGLWKAASCTFSAKRVIRMKPGPEKWTARPPGTPTAITHSCLLHKLAPERGMGVCSAQLKWLRWLLAIDFPFVFVVPSGHPWPCSVLPVG